MSPRACVAMKLIASGVANWAAIVRSPSFSRSGSSTTTTNLPFLVSSSASSIVANGETSWTEWARAGIAPMVRMSGLETAQEQLLDVLREHVNLEVHGFAGSEAAERRRGERVRDEGDRERGLREPSDRQAHALDCDRALLDAVAQDLGRRLDLEPHAVAFGRKRADRADPVHVPLDEVATERLYGSERGLHVHLVAERELPERGAAKRLRHGVEREQAVCDLRCGQAHAVDGDRVADPRERSRLGRAQDDAQAVLPALESLDTTELANDAGEHVPNLSDGPRVTSFLLRLVDVRGDEEILADRARLEARERNRIGQGAHARAGGEGGGGGGAPGGPRRGPGGGTRRGRGPPAGPGEERRGVVAADELRSDEEDE